MSSFRQINERLKAVSAIKTISTTYQEISQKEMADIREVALENRRFIDELFKVYAITKGEYLKEKEKSKEDKESFLDKKEGNVAIFISANARFYGALLWDVWKEVIDHIKNNDTDLVVIGETGRYFAKNNELVSDFTHFHIDDEKPKEKDVKKVIDFVKKYENISVFHGKFQNILKQSSVRTDISGKISAKKEREDSSYLFEPSAEKVLEFFETELITAFFNQAFLEHRLSRHATRVVAMHQAGENAKEKQEELRMTSKRLKRSEMDKKQFEITAPYQIWD